MLETTKRDCAGGTKLFVLKADYPGLPSYNLKHEPGVLTQTRNSFMAASD